jgi:hypothetical protein
MNMIPAQIDIEDVVDIATADQQIEAIAVDIELTEQVAHARIGQHLKKAHGLFKYVRSEGGFEGWVRSRLGRSDEWARQAIAIADAIGNGMPQQLLGLSKSAQIQVVSAPVDVQQLIADRVEAGEVFTAAQVKEFKQQAAAEAVERINADAEQARADLDALKTELASKDKASTAETSRLRADVEELTNKLSEFERQAAEYRKSLPKPEKAKEQAAQTGGVVLGSDGKFHSGSSAEQKKMHDAFMFAFDRLLDLTEDAPSPARIAAGCPDDERSKTVERCDQAISYLNSIKEAINGK